MVWRDPKWFSLTTKGLAQNRNGPLLQLLVYAVKAKNTKVKSISQALNETFDVGS